MIIKASPKKKISDLPRIMSLDENLFHGKKLSYTKYGRYPATPIYV